MNITTLFLLLGDGALGSSRHLARSPLGSARPDSQGT
jgi:hypothetical protein